MPTFRVRRLLKSALPDLAAGELAFCTDTKELYIGTSAGNVLINEAATTFGDMRKSHYDPADTGTVANADKVDGKHAGEFAVSSHTHAGTDITSVVRDADRLDGSHAAAFAAASHTHEGKDITTQVADADKVDGLHASELVSQGHNHDDRYYLKDTIDAFLAGYDFTDLADTPSSYGGQGGKVIQVKTTEDGLEFGTIAGGGSGDMTKAVYDQDNDGLVDDADKVDGYDASDFAAASHDHDSRYYTESEIDMSLSGKANASHTHGGGDITSQVSDADTVDSFHASAFAAAAHDHDSRYYTESEVDTALSGKANSSHTHGGGDITSQVSDSDKVDGQHASAFAAVSHDHDSRYYTESEVDTFLSGKANSSHGHAASDITSGSIDGDRLPDISSSKKGGVPATGSPSGKFLKDDGTWAAISGGGDMLKSTYDTDNDGAVDNAEKLGGELPSYYATATHNHDSAYAPTSKGVTNGDSHDHVGGDGAAITESALSLSDNSTGDVSTSKHGFCPKAPNDTAKFLRGDATWATPSGGADPWTIVTLASDFSTSSTTPVAVTDFKFTPATNKTYIVLGWFLIRTNNATYGARPGISWPSNLTDGCAKVEAASSLTAVTIRTWGQLNTQVAAAGAQADATYSHYASLDAMFITGGSTSGDFQVVLAQESASYTATMQAGSVLMYRTTS
jgi:hypothetical protein